MLHNYMFRPYIKPSSGCIRLALRIMYPDDKVYYFDNEISIIMIEILKAKRIQPEDGLI